MLLPQFTSLQAFGRSIAWSTYEFGASATYPITGISQFGKHLLALCHLRGDNASSTTNLQIGVNNDSATAEYHFQRAHTAEDGAAAAPEGTVVGSGQIVGGNAVTGVYSPVLIQFPWYSSTTRQKSWYIQNAREAAALNQLIGFGTAKRQGTLGVGTLTDPITSFYVAISAAGQNILGTIQVGIVA